jgi:hypothetical protein
VLSKIVNCSIVQANRNDQSYTDYLNHVAEGDLVIFDLGYFVIDSFSKIISKGSQFVARFLKNTVIFNENGVRIDIESLLKNSESAQIDLPILLGREAKLKCRLTASKLTGEALEKRKSKIIREEKKRGVPLKKRDSELDFWSIYVTSLVNESHEEIHNLYRLRWQIELLFKSLKSGLSMREIKDKNPHKTMMLIYTKLILMCFILIMMNTIDGENTEISLYKAIKYYKDKIKPIYKGIIKCDIKWYNKFLIKLQNFTKKSYRLNRPSALQLCGLRPMQQSP